MEKEREEETDSGCSSEGDCILGDREALSKEIENIMSEFSQFSLGDGADNE